MIRLCPLERNFAEAMSRTRLAGNAIMFLWLPSQRRGLAYFVITKPKGPLCCFDEISETIRALLRERQDLESGPLMFMRLSISPFDSLLVPRFHAHVIKLVAHLKILPKVRVVPVSSQ